MSECRRTIPIMDHSSTRRMSLQQCAEEEALQFKWIESQKAGHDLGETAIRTWIGRHWRGFLRHRWLEHLQGKTFWIELDHRDFGLLRTAFQSSPLIDPIIDHLQARSARISTSFSGRSSIRYQWAKCMRSCLPWTSTAAASNAGSIAGGAARSA